MENLKHFIKLILLLMFKIIVKIFNPKKYNALFEVIPLKLN